MQERWGQHPPPLKQLSKLKVFQKGGAAALNLTPSNELVPLLTQNFRVVSGIDGTRDPSQSMSLAEAGERIRTSLAKSKAPWSLLHLAAVYWQIRGAAVEVWSSGWVGGVPGWYTGGVVELVQRGVNSTKWQLVYCTRSIAAEAPDGKMWHLG